MNARATGRTETRHKFVSATAISTSLPVRWASRFKGNQLWIDNYCELACYKFICCDNTLIAEEYQVLSVCHSSLYFVHVIAVPQGDSGGPLMCRDYLTGGWNLVGINSQGPTECGANSRGPAPLFSRVQSYLSWVTSNMAAFKRWCCFMLLNDVAWGVYWHSWTCTCTYEIRKLCVLVMNLNCDMINVVATVMLFCHKVSCAYKLHVCIIMYM